MSSTYQPRTFDLKSVPFRVYCETVFHQGTRAKAERLVADGKVLLQSVSRAEKACDISARVTGAAPVPYDVHVLCGSMSGSFFINGRCSCPMVLNCKHVFAALKAATDRIPVVLPPPAKNAGRPKAGPAKPRLPAEWQRWVQRMAEATVPSEAAAPDPEAESVRLLYILKPANAKGGVNLLLVVIEDRYFAAPVLFLDDARQLDGLFTFGGQNEKLVGIPNVVIKIT